MALCASLAISHAEEEKKAGPPPLYTGPQTELAKRKPSEKTLTAKQIAELYTQITDSKKGLVYEFKPEFQRLQLDPAKKKSKIIKYQKSGKVPYILTGSLYQVKTVKGKKDYKQMRGTCSFYIMNEEGMVIETKNTPLRSMRAS